MAKVTSVSNRKGGVGRTTAELIARDLNIRIFGTRIRGSMAASEAQSAQKSLFDYAPRNNIARDYGRFFDELPPRYRVVAEGRPLPEPDQKENARVVMAMIEAVLKVRANPRH